MKISIVIPCYNVEGFVERAIASCKLSDDVGEMEVICVDDCSTDRTAERLKSLAAKRNDVKVILHSANKKTMEARRTGTIASNGDYVLYLDPDDRFADGILDKICERLATDPVDVLFFGGTAVVYNNDKPLDEEMKARKTWWERRLMPEAGVTAKDTLCQKMFEEGVIPWSVWGRAWKLDLAMKAMDVLPQLPMMYNEDSIQCLVSMKYADRFATFPVAAYEYTVDTGVTKNSNASGSAAQALADLRMLLKATRCFRTRLESNDGYIKYIQALERRLSGMYMSYLRPDMDAEFVFGEDVGDEYLPVLAMWKLESTLMKEILDGIGWFLRLYRKWMKIKMLFVHDEEAKTILLRRIRFLKHRLRHGSI